MEHIEVADESVTSKTQISRDFSQKPRNTSPLKKRLGCKKPSVGAIIACSKTHTGFPQMLTRNSL